MREDSQYYTKIKDSKLESRTAFDFKGFRYLFQYSASRPQIYLEVLLVEPALDLDFLREAIWSPCLIRAPFGVMENDLSLYNSLAGSCLGL